jgi:hypothetical protein
VLIIFLTYLSKELVCVRHLIALLSLGKLLDGSGSNSGNILKIGTDGFHTPSLHGVGRNLALSWVVSVSLQNAWNVRKQCVSKASEYSFGSFLLFLCDAVLSDSSISHMSKGSLVIHTSTLTILIIDSALGLSVYGSDVIVLL